MTGRCAVWTQAATVLAALCAPAHAHATPNQSPGEHWRLYEGTLNGEALETDERWPVTLRIEDDRFGGVSACNSYSGELVGHIPHQSFSVTSMTQRGCGKAVMELESRYLEALAFVETATEHGDFLALSGTGVDLQFRAREAVPLDELVGPRWELSGYFVRRPSGVRGWGDEQRTARLEFSSDGHVSGSTGCRRFTGTYRVESPRVELDDLDVRGRCHGHAEDDDAHLMAVLTDGFELNIYANRLSLTAADGRGLRYEADLSESAGCRSTRGAFGWSAWLILGFAALWGRRSRGGSCPAMQRDHSR